MGAVDGQIVGPIVRFKIGELLGSALGMEVGRPGVGSDVGSADRPELGTFDGLVVGELEI